MSTRKHLSYHSNQINTHILNGQEVSIENSVNIVNGKGVKKVIRTENGKVTKVVKALKPREIKKISNNVFIPRLFKDCNKTRKKCRQ
jgi:hypothetical protein